LDEILSCLQAVSDDEHARQISFVVQQLDAEPAEDPPEVDDEDDDVVDDDDVSLLVRG
jgi:hypothetical protein